MASELANKIYKGINEKYCKRKLSLLSLVLIDEIIKENAAQQTYALDGATCPAHGLKLVDGYCPSLTCIYSPPRK